MPSAKCRLVVSAKCQVPDLFRCETTRPHAKDAKGAEVPELMSSFAPVCDLCVRQSAPPRKMGEFVVVVRRPPAFIAIMAMRFSILGSGSSGNAALVVTENSRILVDAGFSARKLGALLGSVG